MINIPTTLTLSRVFLIPVFIVLFFSEFKHVNIILVCIFILASITDYLDGYLARRYNQTSKLGEFLDPVADKLMVTTALILLTHFYGSVLITIASLIIIIREISVSALREWMSGLGQRVTVAVSTIGKVKTFVQLFAISFLLYKGGIFGFSSFYVGVVLLYFAVFLTLWSFFIYLKATFKHLTERQKSL